MKVKFLPILLLLLYQCSPGKNEPYIASITEWQNKRNTELQDTTGWLALEGLFWLDGGKFDFGSAQNNHYVFPEAFPELAGTIELNELGEVIIYPSENSSQIKLNGNLISAPVKLTTDNPGPPDKLWYADEWLFYAISRFEGKAIRLIHTKSPELSRFKGMDFFPIDENWSFKAKFEKFDSLKTLPVPTVLGSKRAEPWPGNLVFEYEGKSFTLAPSSHPEDKEWFIVFADQTNGNSTYGGGRFLYVDKPNENGETFIDFNKAYSPPCLFSIHATCPLPPAVNRLPFEIPAGEKAITMDH